MAEFPPALAEAAVIGPTSELIRRIEFYEADGVTPWASGVNDDRLIDGSVNIDYSRDERRSVDLELDNSDFGLEHAPEKLWYDKIIKAFMGVRFVDTTPELTTRVRTNLSLNPRAIASTGFTSQSGGWTTTYNQSATGHSLGIVTAAKSTVANAGLAGNDILSMNNLDVMGNTATVRWVGAWFYTSVAGTTATVYLAGDQAGTTNVVTLPVNQWTWLVSSGASNGQAIATVRKGSAAVVGEIAMVTGVISEVNKPTGWFDGAVQDFGNRDYAWTAAANASTSTESVSIIRDRADDTYWETQVGEFMIDSVNEDHFPYTVKINGRDYTKKCMLSRFATATTFASGTAIETAIKAMAQNAGITKFLMPPTGHNLGKDYSYERGVARWEAMKEIADAFGYELFFDAQGYLVMREFLDPVDSPTAYTLATGELQGNLVSYSKSVNDNRIYNKIVVTGESSDSVVVPVSATATNTLSDSPTRIAKLGERVYTYTSAFITTTQQAQDVADAFLKIHALEEFDLNFSSISLFWLEVGEIIEFIDPRPNDGQPTRFLLSTINLPLGLGAMSGNAKRVTVVG